jgi:two-component system, OmpR family, response regulator
MEAAVAERLLLAEDESGLAGMLVDLFGREGYVVDVAADGQAMLHLGLTRRYDVLVVDRGLPAIDGLDVLARLRSRGISTPALVLTALGTVADRVAGLDAGADDYLAKPFALEELLARLRALTRRHADRATTLGLGRRELDLASRMVAGDGQPPVELTEREAELLRLLAARPDRVFTRDDLLVLVFSRADSVTIVDTYVHYLRRKLGRGVVRTVRGIGYRMGLA